MSRKDVKLLQSREDATISESQDDVELSDWGLRLTKSEPTAKSPQYLSPQMAWKTPPPGCSITGKPRLSKSSTEVSSNQ